MAANHHATLVILGDKGVLITGPSGSGKTGLALALLRLCAAGGRFARLVSDDQVFVRESGGRLIGSVPPSIEGLAEARGFGPASLVHERAAVIDLLVRLVPPDVAPRFQEVEAEFIEEVSLARLDLPAGNAEGAVMAIAARLLLPPFG